MCIRDRYQLAILWGLPTVLVVLFIAAVLLAWRKNCHLPGMERQGQIVLADGKTQEEVEEQAVALILGEKKPEPGEKETAEKPKKVSAFCNFWREIAVSDMVIGILGLCAIGLIIIPELVYVRDIYEESYARSNTMFKLTYQAFVLFLSLIHISSRKRSDFIYPSEKTEPGACRTDGSVCTGKILGVQADAEDIPRQTGP